MTVKRTSLSSVFGNGNQRERLRESESESWGSHIERARWKWWRCLGRTVPFSPYSLVWTENCLSHRVLYLARSVESVFHYILCIDAMHVLSCFYSYSWPAFIAFPSVLSHAWLCWLVGWLVTGQWLLGPPIPAPPAQFTSCTGCRFNRLKNPLKNPLKNHLKTIKNSKNGELRHVTE